MLNNKGKSAENAITPSQLNRLGRTTIEQHIGTIWLTGEVTDYYLAPSGHAYFSLKDAKSSIKCTFFKQYNFKKAAIKNGDSVLTFGPATLYEERGTFQVKVERLEKSGIGQMAKAFEELKLKLESMGYFSPEHKKTLPPVINSLAIVTSKNSAAIQDILNVVKRRNPLLDVHIYHASVQGEQATEEIINALLLADINHHDVILLTRGGGSIEDLWTFNDISIAQTLYNLQTICLSAVGHERDTSISDLVADLSAITPTAAAEMLTPDIAHLKTRLHHNHMLLTKLISNLVDRSRQIIDIKYYKIEKSHPKNSINLEKQNLLNKFLKMKQAVQQSTNQLKNEINHKQTMISQYDFKVIKNQDTIKDMYKSMSRCLLKHYEESHSKMNNLASQLNNLSPLATLSRGYSITMMEKNSQIVRDVKRLKIEDKIISILPNGKVKSIVKEIN